MTRVSFDRKELLIGASDAPLCALSHGYGLRDAWFQGVFCFWFVCFVLFLCFCEIHVLYRILGILSTRNIIKQMVVVVLFVKNHWCL